MPLSSLSASYLIVAGGGSGGAYIGGTGLGGGGGAGGLLSGSALTIDTNSTYVVTVGAGGVGTSTSTGTNGANSSFSAYATSAVGGGYGGLTSAGASGGSGGGGGGNLSLNAGGTATSGQGYAGGSSAVASYIGGGGGGAGAVGTNGAAGVGGSGGVGVSSSITGTATYYAGGGGASGGTAGTGGNGGGGNGSTSGAGSAGTANTGGGGAGSTGSSGTTAGGNGGSGVVIISYAGSTQQMAGGTVTITGGNVIHTFTSSGYLTPLTYFNNSLRFRASNSAYVYRTPKVAGNRQIWTWSAWVKRGTLGSGYQEVFSATAASPSDDTNLFGLAFLDDTISTGGGATLWVQTTAVYRDPSAWYHIVMAVDTTQATATNRVKIYVNGSQVTAFSTSTGPALNLQTAVNSVVQHDISGLQPFLTRYFDGYMTNINFIDGQQLTANSFGTYNSYGVWQPVNYGGSYGANGFYLPFNSPSTSTYGALLNGTSQYLSVASNAAFNISSNSFTAECWIKINSLPGGGTFGIISTTYTTNFHTSIDSTGVVYFWIVGSYISTASGVIPLNQWTHLAFVRNGTTANIYVNGINVKTGTLSGTGANSAMYIGTSAHAITSEYLNATLSNVRFVNGTAVYTQNFIPPIANLTAITNTQLLTLQNSTIIDNSTNAFSITNNGSVTTTTVTPFTNTTVLAADQSPQGNNWTPNNISLAPGATYDSMTDVPTLTSANASNYAVWNPLIPSANTFSNGNLTISNASGSNYIPAFSTIVAPSGGKYYYEFTSTTASYPLGVGVAKSTDVPNSSQYIGYTSTEYAYNPSNGNKLNNNTSTAYGASFTANDVIGVALDLVNGTLVFYKNGTSQGTAFSGLTGDFYFAVGSVAGGSTCTGSANFGQQPFTYTPPTGYVALNTYNM